MVHLGLFFWGVEQGADALRLRTGLHGFGPVRYRRFNSSV